MKGEYGEIITVKSDNENIKEILNNLLYDIMNIEFNLWPWVRNMVKYGDFFLYLDIVKNTELQMLFLYHHMKLFVQRGKTLKILIILNSI